MSHPELARESSCRSCGEALRGAFCHACGQPADVARRELRRLVSEAVRSVLNYDSRSLRTLVGMLVDPGTLIREYIAGRRHCYANPVTFYLLVAAVAFFFGEVFSFADPPSSFTAMWEWSRSSSLTSTLLGLVLVPPLTFFLQRAFPRSTWNYTETAVFSLFALATSSILSLLPSLVIDFYFSGQLKGWFLTLVGPLYLSYAAWRVYGLRPMATVARVLFVYACSLLVVAGIVSALVPPSLRQQQLGERQADFLNGWLMLGLIEGAVIMGLFFLLVLGGLVRPDLVLRPERATRVRVLVRYGGGLVLSVLLYVGLIAVAFVPAVEEARRKATVAAAREGAGSADTGALAGVAATDGATPAVGAGSGDP